MKTAVLTADTRHPEDGVVGYEGSDATGFFPAENAIYWIGDAGISASLSDMLAYEGWIDATRDDENSLYRRASVPPVFADGKPAAYGYGLAHETIAGLDCTGHGGALRGFRAHRKNARAARLSVVVMFNHEADAHGAVQDLIEAAMGHKPAAEAPIPDGWDGQWIGPNGLLTRLESGRTHADLHHAGGADRLVLAADGTLVAPGVVLARGPQGVTMTRSDDNTQATLTPLPLLDSADGAAIAGTTTRMNWAQRWRSWRAAAASMRALPDFWAPGGWSGWPRRARMSGRWPPAGRWMHPRRATGRWWSHAMARARSAG